MKKQRFCASILTVMKEKDIKILAIETSCDETAASLVVEKDGKPEVISNIVSSQIDLHTKTGGVVPEVASRAHIESILPVIDEALAGSKLDELTHIAVTAGPGLMGSLMVGFDSAKSLAYGLGLPIIPVNHIEGHIYSAYEGEFPILSLTVSGGHTSLTNMLDHGEYQTIGETLDDAAGEAFDKVAKLLSLGYPGGPIVSKYAKIFRDSKKETKVVFPRPMLDRPGFDFSFSGLKTSVLTHVKKLTVSSYQLTAADKEEICFAFEKAAVEVLVLKALKAAKQYKPKAVILAGGVSANRRLQEVLKKTMKENGYELFLPPKDMTGDNAAMIGLAAYYHIVRGDVSSWDKLELNSNMKL